jgi:hypothetical protein
MDLLSTTLLVLGFVTFGVGALARNLYESPDQEADAVPFHLGFDRNWLLVPREGTTSASMALVCHCRMFAGWCRDGLRRCNYQESLAVSLKGDTRGDMGKHGDGEAIHQSRVGRSEDPPKNGLCGKPVMQRQYMNIFARMGKDLHVKPPFIMTTGCAGERMESVHVYGTNKLSHGRRLNNLLGAAPRGRDNKSYPSVWSSAVDWENTGGRNPDP